MFGPRPILDRSNVCVFRCELPDRGRRPRPATSSAHLKEGHVPGAAGQSSRRWGCQRLTIVIDGHQSDAWPNSTTMSLVESQDRGTLGAAADPRHNRHTCLLNKNRHRQAVAALRPGPLESTQKWRMAGPRSNQRRALCLTQPMFSERLLVNIITKHAAGPGPFLAAHGASSICRHGRHGGGPRSAAEGRRLISRPQQGGLR